MRLSVKLFLSFFFISIIPLGVSLLVSQTRAAEALNNAALEKLTGLEASKGAEIDRYFTNIRDQIITFSEDQMIVDAMREYRTRFRQFRTDNDITSQDITRMQESLKGYYRDEFNAEFRSRNGESNSDWESYFSQLDTDSIAFQYYFIKANSNPLGEKHLLDRPDDLSAYSDLHGAVHPVVRNYLEKFGYYDIFLVDPESGDILYSVFKELDYSTSLIDGPYADTNFGECFREANALSREEDFIFVDFEPYPPSYMDAASFIASPIFDNGEKIGVAMFQMPVDRINEIMQSREGLGETGELFLAGRGRGGDTQLRSTRVDPLSGVESEIGSPVSNQHIDTALNGELSEGVDVWGNETYLSSTRPLNVLGVSWTVSAIQQSGEALSAAQNLTKLILLIALVAISAVILTTILLSRNIIKPIEHVVQFAKHLARGDLGQRLSEGNSSRRTEMEEMAFALNRMVEALKRKSDAAAAIAEGDLNQTIDVSSEVDELGKAMVDMVAGLNSLIGSVRENSGQVAQAADTVHETSRKLTEAAQQQSISLRDITGSVNGIGVQAKSNAGSAQKVDALAVEAQEAAVTGNRQMDTMVTAMDEIHQASQEISKIIKVINDITFQTNLLSLNAAVEAARAGKYGKGFSVVAEEVRQLAARSTDAAKETESIIAASISKMDSGMSIARESALSLQAIEEKVRGVNEIISTINTASKEQADGVGQIGGGIREVEAVTESNSAIAAEMTEASEQLRLNSLELQALLERFTLTDS